jgi:hypothetical protein
MSKTLWAWGTHVRSDRTLKRYFNKINKRFFKSAVPSNICVRWADENDDDLEEGCEQKYFGWTEAGEGRHKYAIVISRIKNPGTVAMLATLSHEMIHCATECKDDHGKAFSDWHEILTARGLFRKGALLRGLTIF